MCPAIESAVVQALSVAEINAARATCLALLESRSGRSDVLLRALDALDDALDDHDSARRGRAHPPDAPPCEPITRRDAARATKEAAHAMYAATGDPALRDRLLAEYDSLACKEAQRFASTREPLEDVQQVARCALVAALQRFDPMRGVAFAVYASKCIRGELMRHFRDRVWDVHVPRGTHDAYFATRAVAEDLTQERGRAPTVSEVALRLDARPDHVLNVMEAARAFRVASLDADVFGDGRTTQLPWDEPGFERVDREIDAERTLRSLLALLSDDDRTLVTWYYFRDLNQFEIARRLRVSQVTVSRRLARIVDRLRNVATLATDP